MGMSGGTLLFSSRALRGGRAGYNSDRGPPAWSMCMCVAWKREGEKAGSQVYDAISTSEAWFVAVDNFSISICATALCLRAIYLSAPRAERAPPLSPPGFPSCRRYLTYDLRHGGPMEPV